MEWRNTIWQASGTVKLWQATPTTARLTQPRAPGGWVGITKDILTEVLGTAQDAKLVGLPAEAARALRLMYPKLVTPSNRE